MNTELLHDLSREQVQSHLERVEPSESISDSIADELSLTVFAQPEAMKAVGRRLAMMRAGLSPVDKPLGSLYFAGPSGVGKTETAYAIEKFIMGKNDSGRLKILNMSEYQEAHYAARFFGSPPGYVDYDQPPVIPHEWLNGREPSIIVFDEFEKANPAIHRAVLSILDKGHLDARDARKGVQPLDFTNAVLIFTSNLAGQEVTNITEEKEKHIGFSPSTATKNKHRDISAAVDREMRKTYAPELLKRFDDIIVFQPLEGAEVYNALITKFLGKLNDQWKARLGVKAPYFDMTREARAFLVGLVGHEGGRAMGREFDHHILDGLADVLLSTDYTRRPYVADIEDGKTYWYTDVRAPEEEERPAVLVERQPDKALKITKLPDLRGDMNGDLVLQAGGKNDESWGVNDPGDDDSEDDLENGEEPPQDDEINRNVRFHIPGGDKKWPIINISVQIQEEGRPDKIQIVEGIPLVEEI